MEISKETLEFCDWLIDGVTLAANHPHLASEAQKIETAKKEIGAALSEAGGVPLGVHRER